MWFCHTYLKMTPCAHPTLNFELERHLHFMVIVMIIIAISNVLPTYHLQVDQLAGEFDKRVVDCLLSSLFVLDRFTSSLENESFQNHRL
jgi:hypothetical protein